MTVDSGASTRHGEPAATTDPADTDVAHTDVAHTAASDPAATSVVPAANGAQPATRRSPADEALADSRLRASLSPSRAADFKTCPLLYRLRSIDRIPEPATPDQARGTLVHAVLEKLFDLPAPERTPETAGSLVEPQWQRLQAEFPELADVVSGDDDRAVFITSTHELLTGYFGLEDPRRLDPAEREYLVSTEIDEGRLQLRGYIDRLDVAPDGSIRVVDYKTGGAPREAFEARALFQLKFYALVLWRTRGVVPKVLRLVYLKDTEICDFTPDVDELARFEKTLVALWAAIAQARAAREFRPKPSRLCGWCAHQSRCPEFGGVTPPYPEEFEQEAAAVPGPALPPD